MSNSNGQIEHLQDEIEKIKEYKRNLTFTYLHLEKVEKTINGEQRGWLQGHVAALREVTRKLDELANGLPF